MDEARGVREFWFGKLPVSPEALAARMDFWFGEDASSLAVRDAEIRARFGEVLERAAGDRLESWADGPRRRLSLILLLDQFPRNIFRGTARAFAYDSRALALTLSGMQSGADAALDAAERIFFYMPLQHAESREVQDESVAACRRLLAEAPAELRPSFATVLEYAEHHRSVIERFGRFPHRNRVLGRESTPAEEAWLSVSGERFGQ
ncbi:MAG TPA: DUF924 family protein [Steroidobacteraceae bacterium]|nr:DUF924 family protein [Steroidobacteraceae bacterium]